MRRRSRDSCAERGARGRGRHDRGRRAGTASRTACAGSRARYPPLRHLAVLAVVARGARRADLVYATTMIRRAALGARARAAAARRQARRGRGVRARSAHRGASRHARGVPARSGGLRVRLLRRPRERARSGARGTCLCPSAYLREIALGWGLDPARVSVVPNPAPELPVAAAAGGATRRARHHGRHARHRRAADAAEGARRRARGGRAGART